MHIHMYAPSGEAKFWIEPKIELDIDLDIAALEEPERSPLISKVS